MRLLRLELLAVALLSALAAGCGRVVVDPGATSPGPGDPGAGGAGQGTPRRRATVSSHWEHVCALDLDGGLSCWGVNTSGELGVGPSPSRSLKPLRVDPLHTYKDVYAGVGTTCAVRDDGSLWCWGRNMGGALATGDRQDHSSPVRVGDRSDYASVAVGSGFGCGVRADGTMDCWGGQDFGANQEGPFDASVLTKPTPFAGPWVSVASHWYWTLAVREDGTVWAAQNDGHFKEVLLSPCSRVSTGPVDLLVVDRKGTLGRLGGNGLDDVVPLGEGFGGDLSTSYRTCAIARDDSLWCGADQGMGALSQLGTDRDWSSVATATSYACATKDDGSLWCWGKVMSDVGELLLDYGDVPTRLELPKD